MRKIDYLVIHQSASSWGDVNAIDAWHKARGWSGIGYHRVVLNGKRFAKGGYDVKLDGVIQQGRPDDKPGAHCPEYNRNSLGICCIGDGPAFAEPGKVGYMSRRQWAALVDACYRLCQRYGVPTAHIIGHRDAPSAKKQGKTCPGFDCQRLRAAVTALAKEHG